MQQNGVNDDLVVCVWEKKRPSGSKVYFVLIGLGTGVETSWVLVVDHVVKDTLVHILDITFGPENAEFVIINRPDG
jgi:hypothetical protein